MYGIFLCLLNDESFIRVNEWVNANFSVIDMLLASICECVGNNRIFQCLFMLRRVEIGLKQPGRKQV